MKNPIVNCFIHYGDSQHTPLLTVRFHGTKSMLAEAVREAKKENWPIRVVMVQS